MYLSNGKDFAYQWDRGIEVQTSDSDGVIRKAYNEHSKYSYIVEADDGWYKVPDILFVSGKKIILEVLKTDSSTLATSEDEIYHVDGGEYISVYPSAKPTDYVFTEEEQRLYDALKAEIDDIQDDIDDIETSIGNINTTLLSKADASSVYTKSQTDNIINKNAITSFSPRKIALKHLFDAYYVSALAYGNDSYWYMMFRKSNGNTIMARFSDFRSLTTSQYLQITATDGDANNPYHVNSMTIVGNFAYVADGKARVLVCNKNTLSYVKVIPVNGLPDNAVVWAIAYSGSNNLFYIKTTTGIYSIVRNGGEFEQLTNIATVDLTLFDKMEFSSRTGQGMAYYDGKLYLPYTVKRGDTEPIVNGAVIVIDVATGKQQIVTYDCDYGDEPEDIEFLNGYGYIAGTRQYSTYLCEFSLGRHYLENESFVVHVHGSGSSVESSNMSADSIGKYVELYNKAPIAIVHTNYEHDPQYSSVYTFAGMVDASVSLEGTGYYAKFVKFSDPQQIDVVYVTNTDDGSGKYECIKRYESVSGSAGGAVTSVNGQTGDVVLTIPSAYDDTDVRGLIAGKANSSHTHAQSDITGLADALGTKLTDPQDGSVGDVLTLTDDGLAWQTPSGGGASEWTKISTLDLSTDTQFTLDLSTPATEIALVCNACKGSTTTASAGSVTFNNSVTISQLIQYSGSSTQWYSKALVIDICGCLFAFRGGATINQNTAGYSSAGLNYANQTIAGNINKITIVQNPSYPWSSGTVEVYAK